MLRFPTLNFGWRQRLPQILQGEAAECGLACLAMVASYHGHVTDLLSLRQRFTLSMRGATLKDLVDISSALHLSARPIKIELTELAHVRLPCILHWNMNHFVVLNRVSTEVDGSLKSIVIHDPAQGRTTVKAAQVSECFTGIALELAPSPSFQQKLDIRKIKIFHLLRGSKGVSGSLLQLVGLALALELFALFGPLFVQLVLDGPIATSDREMLTVCALGFALLVVAQTLLSAFRSWVVMFISTHMNMQLLSGVFAHLLRLPLWFFAKRHLGDVVSRFNSIHAIQTTLSSKFIEALLDGLLAISTLVVLFCYSAKLTVAVLSAATLYALLRAGLSVSVRRAREEQLSFEAREQSVFLESIRGIQAIKLFNHEQERHARWLNAYAATLNRNIVVQKLTIFFAGAMALLSGIEHIIVIWLGARLVIAGLFSIGMLYAFLAYKAVFTGRVYSLIDKLQELKMLSLQGERLADIVLTPTEEFSGPLRDFALDEKADLTIELRNVSFRYSDVDPWIIRHLSLIIKPGQSVALVGESGCGKTTLLKMLIGILNPVEGEILVGGVALAQFGTHRYRSLIGTVMQDDQLFAGNIADNISFFDHAAEMTEVRRCAIAASISKDIDQMAMGYLTLIGDMGTSLSGGQQQRLLLARAFYKKPRILFLDEATSHLDVANEARVNASVHGLAMTRVIVAHRRETIETVERVLELSSGTIVKDFVQNVGEDFALCNRISA